MPRLNSVQALAAQLVHPVRLDHPARFVAREIARCSDISMAMVFVQTKLAEMREYEPRPITTERRGTLRYLEAAQEALIQRRVNRANWGLS